MVESIEKSPLFKTNDQILSSNIQLSPSSRKKEISYQSRTSDSQSPGVIDQKALKSLQKLGWQIYRPVTAQQINFKLNDNEYQKTAGYLKAIAQVPPKSFAQLVEWSQKMLELIANTQELEPRLASALPQLEGYAERQRRNLERGEKLALGALCRKVHDGSRECLALIAKTWGYNHPSWLKKALALIGYRKNNNRARVTKKRSFQICPMGEEISALPFERLEPTLLVIQSICSRAIMCGNEKSLQIALSHAPIDVIKVQDYSLPGEPEWGFLQHVQEKIPFAIRLVHPKKWSRLEFDCFVSCYGQGPAEQMKAISPIFDFESEISGAMRSHMLALTSFRAPAISQDQLFTELEVRGWEQVKRIQAPSICPNRPRTPMVCEISEEKLFHFPAVMIGWQVVKRSPPSGLAPSSSHRAMQKQIQCLQDDAFGHLQMAISPYEAVSKLIYGYAGASGEIKDFFMQFINEADGFLKQRDELVSDLESLEPARATLFISSIYYNRLDCFTAWVMINALAAHLYDLELHLGCSLQLPLSEVKESLIDLERKLSSCGLQKLTSDVDFQTVQSQTHMSLILNQGRSVGGKLLMCEGWTDHIPKIASGDECCFSGYPKYGKSQIKQRTCGQNQSEEKTPIFVYFTSDC